MRRPFVLLLALLLIITGSSCGTIRGVIRKARQPKVKETAEDTRPVAIGSIEMVNPDDKFVLARLTSNVVLPNGTELSSMGANGQIAKLKTTPERKGIFITADIVSGEPKKGDIIHHGGTPAATDAPAPAPGPVSASNPPPLPVSPGPALPPITDDTRAPVAGESPNDFLRITPR